VTTLCLGDCQIGGGRLPPGRVQVGSKSLIPIGPIGTLANCTWVIYSSKTHNGKANCPNVGKVLLSTVGKHAAGCSGLTDCKMRSWNNPNVSDFNPYRICVAIPPRAPSQDTIQDFKSNRTSSLHVPVMLGGIRVCTRGYVAAGTFFVDIRCRRPFFC